MSEYSTLLLELPDELKRLAALGIGASILVALVVFHGAGLQRIFIHHQTVEARLIDRRTHLLKPSFLVGWSVLLMLLLHVMEISIWALALCALGLIKGFHDAVNYSANAYTTLGYGNVTVEKQWQNIGPIIAVSGTLCFAWTTGVLVAIAANFNQDQRREIKRQAKRQSKIERFEPSDF